jgi:hypothetical protein
MADIRVPFPRSILPAVRARESTYSLIDRISMVDEVNFDSGHKDRSNELLLERDGKSSVYLNGSPTPIQV